MVERNVAEIEQIHQSLARMIARGATTAAHLGLPDVVTILREAERAAVRAVPEAVDSVSGPCQVAIR